MSHKVLLENNTVLDKNALNNHTPTGGINFKVPLHYGNMAHPRQAPNIL